MRRVRATIVAVEKQRVLLALILACFLLGDSPANHPKENIQHTEHGESLKLKTLILPTWRVW
jgi:hypothetical protein